MLIQRTSGCDCGSHQDGEKSGFFTQSTSLGNGKSTREPISHINGSFSRNNGNDLCNPCAVNITGRQDYA